MNFTKSPFDMLRLSQNLRNLANMRHACVNKVRREDPTIIAESESEEDVCKIKTTTIGEDGT